MTPTAPTSGDGGRLDALIEAVAEKVDAKRSPDAKDEDERKALNKAAQKTSLELQQEKLKSRRKERKLRTSYANKVFNYLCVYSSFCGFVLLAEGFHLLSFSIDRYVIVALVGSTAIAAIGVVSSVVRGLFPPPR